MHWKRENYCEHGYNVNKNPDDIEECLEEKRS
jgi:hypothetical protein